jgi:hypothetical protein
MQATQGQTTAMADLWAFFFLPCGLTPQITGSQKMQSEERAAQLLDIRWKPLGKEVEILISYTHASTNS